jgi:hypothetical protein
MNEIISKVGPILLVFWNPKFMDGHRPTWMIIEIGLKSQLGSTLNVHNVGSKFEISNIEVSNPM